jgi:hypothetical protein
MPKKSFKKFSLLFIVILIFFATTLVFGITRADAPAGDIPNPLDATSFTDLIGDIIVWVRNIGIGIAIIMIIYAGFLFMTSGGSEEKVTTARKTLIWSLIGLAILIMGSAWISLIKNILGG